MTPVEELPDDSALLKRLLSAEREQRQAAIDEAVKAKIDEAVRTAVDEAVKAAVAAILRRYYGPRSEKFDPRQLLLFGQQVVSVRPSTSSIWLRSPSSWDHLNSGGGPWRTTSGMRARNDFGAAC